MIFFKSTGSGFAHAMKKKFTIKLQIFLRININKALNLHNYHHQLDHFFAKLDNFNCYIGSKIKANYINHNTNLIEANFGINLKINRIKVILNNFIL